MSLTTNLELATWLHSDTVSLDDFNSNFEKIDGALQDFVVDEGANGIWKYRKWNSGLYECWGKDVVTSTIDSKWGSAYESSSPITVQTYPITFKSIEYFNVSAGSDSYAVMSVEMQGRADKSLSQPPRMFFTRPTSCETNTYAMFIHVKGTWK